MWGVIVGLFGETTSWCCSWGSVVENRYLRGGEGRNAQVVHISLPALRQLLWVLEGGEFSDGWVSQAWASHQGLHSVLTHCEHP